MLAGRSRVRSPRVKSRTSDDHEVTLEVLGHLERRAEQLRERVAARGGPNAETSSDNAELASLETAIAAADSVRWRRSADEPIAVSNIAEILATVVDQDGVLLLRKTTADRWRCECGCDRAIAEDRIIRWRPTNTTAPAKEVESPIVSPTSYRGRQRLAIIDDRIRYLEGKAEELKAKGSPARYEKDELEALAWIRELALRAGRGEKS